MSLFRMRKMRLQLTEVNFLKPPKLKGRLEGIKCSLYRAIIRASIQQVVSF